jgi:rhamnogalacturonyl hydrolase YesR
MHESPDTRRRLLKLMLSSGAALALPPIPALAREAAARAQALACVFRANDFWQKTNPPQQRAFWDWAAYHTGNLAAVELTGNPGWHAYTVAWADNNGWSSARSNDRTNWKYTYGETDEHVLFGDWQCCFQVYADLYREDPKHDPKKIARAREVMEYQMGTPNSDYWWWADALYMAMPVMTRMYKVTGNTRYLDKLVEYFKWADHLMYDPEAGLYYRDAKYLYPKHKTAAGGKDFWARGDGWVMAGIARVLTDLPRMHPSRPLFEERFKRMAAVLKPLQRPEGHWTRSLLDAQQAPGPESSGTSFFTFGYLWGINNGLLARAEYGPTAERGWQFLSGTALQPDGRVGYVQPIGERAIPGQVVDQNSTAPFGVGAFLLAGTEMVRYLDRGQT